MAKDPVPTVVTIDLPDDETGELEISHTVRIGKVDVRVLKEAHQWHLLRSSGDPISIIKAFIHPDDFSALDTMLSSRRNLPDDLLTNILSAITEKPTGHPTPASSDS